jgi:hypothetical protein
MASKLSDKQRAIDEEHYLTPLEIKLLECVIILENRLHGGFVMVNERTKKLLDGKFSERETTDKDK